MLAVCGPNGGCKGRSAVDAHLAIVEADPEPKSLPRYLSGAIESAYDLRVGRRLEAMGHNRHFDVKRSVLWWFDCDSKCE